jgi:hypothetical protein
MVTQQHRDVNCTFLRAGRGANKFTEVKPALILKINAEAYQKELEVNIE